ncbi:MAG TPA: DNA repair protein RecN [Thermoanaerobacterales bacterium]|nr:DNA repair protein RecN [Thermoanaerobacterales bacterium]
MLLKLYIKNFALIDELDLTFKNGLNVLTGETGAGKSIIIDAISMIIGERASSEYIRSGTESAEITALFDYNNEQINIILSENGIESDGDNIIISRQLTEQGKNYCRLNGKIVPVFLLKKISEHLVDIHGQHQHQSLFHSKNHLKILDSLGTEELIEYKKTVNQLYREYLYLNRQLKDALKKYHEIEKQKETIKFELDEIEKANMRPGEDKELKEKSEILQNAEKIYNALEIGYSLLYRGNEMPSIIDNLNRLIICLEDIKDCFKPINPSLDFFKNLLFELEDHASTLRNYKEKIDFNPQELDKLEARMTTIDRLKAKYNMSIDDLLNYKEQIETKLAHVLNVDEEILKLKNKLKKVSSELVNYANKLTNSRKKVAKKLENDIAKELNELGMKNIKFFVNISRIQEADGLLVNDKKYKITNDGFDIVDFLISTNPGEPLKPLAKIVSGGEASRIMLALKNILAKVDNIPCLIFDEIDAGIGGRTAQIVGEKLAKVARTHQVLCVTHSPQIASMGDYHFLIKKQTSKNKTTTTVNQVTGKNRIRELARMLSGAEITEKTLKHAEEMLQLADQLKKI